MSRDAVLVDADWVESHLDHDNLLLVEVDEDTSAYDKGHIKGAVKIDWKEDLQDPVRRDFVNKAQFEQLVSRRGISDNDTVVLYGGNNNWFAAYAYWYFRYYGHDNVVLMDGGRKKWELEQRELTTDVADVKAVAGYRTAGSDESIRALRDYVRDCADAPGGALVDVRSPEEYRGELYAPAHLPQEAAQRPGHIPGAVNIPWSKSVDADTGAFLPKDELEKLYADQGVVPSAEVVAYCRIGERSAHTWFVLHELLGFTNVRNYDGSWTEWGSLVGVPIER